MSRFAAMSLLFAVACTPQSAELVEGEVVGYLSSTTSFTLIKGNFDPVDVEELGGDTWNIDCRVFEEGSDLERLEDPLDICNDEGLPVEDEVWLDLGAYQAFRMPLDTWRGEGILLAEGDLQVGFHQRMPGGEDFRFIWSIDPTFQPTRCTGNGTESEPLDGDWVEGWSTEIDRILERVERGDDIPEFMANAAEESQGGELYFLNAFSFQWDPGGEPQASDREIWTLPEEWRAGFGLGTFVEEDTNMRENRFADPALHILFEADIGGGIPAEGLLYGDCPDGETIDDCVPWQDARQKARGIANNVRDEMALVSPPDDPHQFMPIAHANEWRTHDGRPEGLDGWAELAYSWVMIRPDSNIEKGGDVSGFFQLVLDGDDSQSRFFVQGEFEVPRIKRERWGGRDLRKEKLEEAEIERCQ